MKQLTFLDICAGIGGFRLGLETAGHKCIGYCEHDKFAVASYQAMYDTEGEWYADDVTKLKPEDVPYADIWTFGFPCQDVSIAGKQRGLSGKRSGIYYSIIDLIKGKEESDKPTYLLVENVKNLLSVNAGFDFAAVLSEMDEAGYDVRWQVLNSKDFGVPQNRERVFLIANFRNRGKRKILFVRGENTETGIQVVGDVREDGWIDLAKRVYSTEGISPCLNTCAGGNLQPKILCAAAQSSDGPKTTENARCQAVKYRMAIPDCNDSSGMAAQAVLTPDRLEKRQNGRRMKNAGEPMFTLTARDRHGVYLKDGIMRDKGDRIVAVSPNHDDLRYKAGKGSIQKPDAGERIGTACKYGRIRRLTPRECFRLQGFPDELYERAASVNSESQLYKQAGNAVTATVAFAVAMSLPESREEELVGLGNRRG